MTKSTLLPDTLGVFLKVVNYGHQLLTLIIWIQQELCVAERTTEHTSFVVRD